MTNLFPIQKQPRNHLQKYRPFLAIIKLNSPENKSKEKQTRTYPKWKNTTHFWFHPEILDLLVSRCRLHLEDSLLFLLDNSHHRPCIHRHSPSHAFEVGSPTTTKRKSF